jgi:hypothetical protein
MMVTKPLSHAKLKAAVDAVSKAKSIVGGARLLNISRGNIEHRLRQAERRGLRPTFAVAETPDAGATLVKTVKHLEKELRAAQKESADNIAIKEIIGRTAFEASAIEPPKWISTPLAKPSSPGVPTLFLSDLHWGEVVHPAQINGVNKYNMTIAHERMQYTIETAIHLLRILDRDMDYPGIVVPLGGDMISGNIHDELQATNELNTMPTVLDLYGVLISAITKLADTFGSVFLPCVSGNHGRDTRKIWSKDRNHTSFDWLLYQFLAKHFAADKRITFYIPDGSDAFYRVFDVRYLLTHGDQFRGGDSIIGPLGPLTRGNQKKLARNTAVDMAYDLMICGHWHQYIHLMRLIVNGSMKGYDEYAYQGNFSFEPPTQALWMTHPKFGITYRMPVFCEKPKAKKISAWVSTPKG